MHRGDQIRLKVLDKEPLTCSERILGEARVEQKGGDINLFEKLEKLRPEEAWVPHKLKLELTRPGKVMQNSFIEFEVLWEAYQEAYQDKVPRTRKRTNNSIVCNGMLVEGQIGILSVRII